MLYIFEQKTVKTRKNHTCWGCAREFPPGTKMEIQIEKDEGGFQRTYWCQDCMKYLSLYGYKDDGCGFGDLTDQLIYIT